MLNIFVKNFENLEKLSDFLAETYQFSTPQRQLLVDIVFFELHHQHLPVEARVFQHHDMDDDLGVSFSQFQFMVLLNSPTLNENELINFGKKIHHDLDLLNHDVILVWDMQKLLRK